MHNTQYSAAGLFVWHPATSLRSGIFNGGQKRVPKSPPTPYCGTLCTTSNRKWIMELPISLRWLQAHNFQLLTPWYWESGRVNSLKSEYYKETGNEILPFAGRQDNDTIAGFKIENGVIQETVVTIHLTWSGKREHEGYPITQEHESIFDWITHVMNVDTQKWINEGELEDIIANQARSLSDLDGFCVFSVTPCPRTFSYTRFSEPLIGQSDKLLGIDNRLFQIHPI